MFRPRCRMLRSQVLFLGLLLSLAGCPGTGGTTPDGNENDNGNGGQGSGVLNGKVSGVSGEPVAGASVSLSNGRSTSTDENGFFSFAELQAGAKLVARIRAAGYASTSKALVVDAAGEAAPNCVLLAPAATKVLVNADADSTQRSGDSAVTVSAGSLVDADGNAVSGMVDLTATFLDPSTDGVLAFPGSFDSAEGADGQAVTLESFGFAVYELEQDGNEVNLAPGATAEIEYVLPGNSQSNYTVGDTIPLWEFDDDTAMWKQAGVGEIRLASDGSGRLAWFAIVDHFSSWNCDAPIEDKNCVSGRVVFEGSPLAGAEITAVGVTYNGTTSTRTGSDGRFCLDVKRGSTVRIEVRLNGAATPIATREVTVPDTSGDCASGACTPIDDVSVNLDACVEGTVTDPDGSPVGGATVRVVPGETVTTAADGSYCAAAPSGLEVYVFVEGRPSVKVQTTIAGACGAGTCASADLSLTLAADGDTVGTLGAQATRFFGGFFGTSDSFSLFGSFLLYDAETLAELGVGLSIPGLEMTTTEIDGCTVTTQTYTYNSTDDFDFSDFGGLSGIGALDPGEPGTASNGLATVELLRGDPASVDPPLPFLAGNFSPEESSEELLALGFASEQAVSFAFPGGADLGAFNTSIDVPAIPEVSSPDLSDDTTTLDFGGPLSLVWDAGSAQETIFVTLTSSTSEFTTNPDGTFTSVSESAYAICEFPDTGTATVSAAVTSRLPNEGSNLSKFLNVERRRQRQINVPLRRVAGNGVVQVFGGASVGRSFFELPDVPDLPDIDPCDFITCDEGQVCNPETFLCEPG